MARLSTHVLDIRSGRPAEGVAIRLFRLEGDARRLLVETRTNGDGRSERPLLSGDAGEPGAYELEFAIGDYFRSAGAPLSEPAFLEIVPIRFAIAEQDGHYHVPLLCSPWAYSTYRGS